jgi:hypothetical protein
MPRRAAVAASNDWPGFVRDVEPPVRPHVERALLATHERLRSDRDHDVERPSDVDAKEVGWRHADDRVGHAIDRQRLSDRICRATEPRLPEPVADDRNRPVRPAAARVVRLAERASEDRLHAEPLEETPARPDAVYVFGLRCLREVQPAIRPRERIVEEIAVRAHLLPDRVGPCVAPLVSDTEYGETLRLFHRQRADQQAVENRENRRVRADAKREREDRDGGDDRRGAQRAKRIADVRHVHLIRNRLDSWNPATRQNPVEPRRALFPEHP